MRFGGGQRGLRVQSDRDNAHRKRHIIGCGLWLRCSGGMVEQCCVRVCAGLPALWQTPAWLRCVGLLLGYFSTYYWSAVMFGESRPPMAPNVPGLQKSSQSCKKSVQSSKKKLQNEDPNFESCETFVPKWRSSGVCRVRRVGRACELKRLRVQTW